MGKEKSTQEKLAQIEVSLADERYSNQKLVQKLHETEVDMQNKVNEAKDDLRASVRDKNLELKTLRSQRDCMYQELQQLKNKSINPQMRYTREDMNDAY